MRNYDNIKLMLRIALYSYIENDDIILNRKDHIIQEPNVVDGKIEGTIDKKIGTITISVKIEDFISIYKDVLEDDSILAKDLLLTMTDHIFYDATFKEIDKGYTGYIETWINEGITLTEV